MKGLVIEIQGQNMVVVDPKGNFKRIKYRNGFDIGQEIDLNTVPAVKYTQILKRSALIAAMFIFVFCIGVYSYYTPYTYVSVDINPSIEIVLNRFERVLDVQPLNDDAKKLVGEQNSFMHKSVDQVIENIVDEALKENYLKDDAQNEILIAVAASNSNLAEQIGQSVQQCAQNKIKEDQINANIDIENTDLKQHEQAKTEHISVGKLLLLERLQQVVPAASIDEVRNRSVKEIVTRIKQSQNTAAKKEETENTGIAASVPQSENNRIKNLPQNNAKDKKSGRENEKKDSGNKLKKDWNMQQEHDTQEQKKIERFNPKEQNEKVKADDDADQPQSPIQEDLYGQNYDDHRDEGDGKEGSDSIDKNEQNRANADDDGMQYPKKENQDKNTKQKEDHWNDKRKDKNDDERYLDNSSKADDKEKDKGNNHRKNE